MRHITPLAAALWLGATPAGAMNLGPLPPGAVSHSYMHGASEIVTYVMFDPAPFRARLPAGTDFVTLKQMAGSYPGLAAWLKQHPDREGWAWSFFEIVGVRSMAYDGVRSPPNGAMAVWYPAVRRLDRSDARPKGHNLLALGVWVSGRRLAAHMRARGYPAGDGRVRFSYGAHRLTAALDAPGLKIEAGCRLQGPLTTPDWAKTASTYQTMWSPAGGPSTFEVVSWAGHRTRDCVDPSWRVSGSAPFAVAFAARPHGEPGMDDAEVGGTEADFGYELIGGLYRR